MMISDADRSKSRRQMRKRILQLVPGRGMRNPTGQIALWVVWLVCTLACGANVGGGRAPALTEAQGDVIGAAEIQAMGARSAWDVLSRRARHLNLGETAQWRAEQEARSGNTVKTACPATGGCPVAPAEVFVDGVAINDIQALRTIPAQDVVRIHIMNGRDAATSFGRAAPGGAIVITTRRGMNSGKRS